MFFLFTVVPVVPSSAESNHRKNFVFSLILLLMG